MAFLVLFPLVLFFPFCCLLFFSVLYPEQSTWKPQEEFEPLSAKTCLSSRSLASFLILYLFVLFRFAFLLFFSSFSSASDVGAREEFDQLSAQTCEVQAEQRKEAASQGTTKNQETQEEDRRCVCQTKKEKRQRKRTTKTIGADLLSNRRN